MTATTPKKTETKRHGSAVADKLIVRGAREHNLKDISLELPRDALIVFTGLSGSGKSSLAFDTILLKVNADMLKVCQLMPDSS
jgi:excinuclease ABC subunit A